MITSLHLKTALMASYRYRGQSVVGDEVQFGLSLADVLVDTGKEIIEIECKTSKSDLKADSNKAKHLYYKKEDNDQYCCPNKFYICVPTELVEEAKFWVETENPKYGIIEFCNQAHTAYEKYSRKWEKMTRVIKRAKSLRQKYVSYTRTIALRSASALINHRIEIAQGKWVWGK